MRRCIKWNEAYCAICMQFKVQCDTASVMLVCCSCFCQKSCRWALLTSVFVGIPWPCWRWHSKWSRCLRSSPHFYSCQIWPCWWSQDVGRLPQKVHQVLNRSACCQNAVLAWSMSFSILLVSVKHRAHGSPLRHSVVDSCMIWGKEKEEKKTSKKK